MKNEPVALLIVLFKKKIEEYSRLRDREKKNHFEELCT